MKKLCLLVVMAIIFTLAGCQKTAQDTTSDTNTSSVSNTSSTNSTTTDVIDVSETTSEEVRSMYLSLYHERTKEMEVIDQKNEAQAKENGSNDWHTEPFISQEMKEIFQRMGFNINTYSIDIVDNINFEIIKFYYPILLDSGDVLYIDESGYLRRAYAYAEYQTTYAVEGPNIHSQEYDDIKEDVKIIHTGPEGRILIKNDVLETWEFGTQKATKQLPKDAVYCGESHWEGFIFRAGSDVYAVYFQEGGISMDAIAHGVKNVIVADYKLNSDAWSQPLFQMQDGSVKAYCDWAGDENAPIDDESHLVAPYHEGGYK